MKMKRGICAALCAALLAGLFAGCGGEKAQEPAVTPELSKAQAGTMTYADTIAWDGEYDVVVVGFGGAGATSAIYAADAGASVLVTEKAPEGNEGGNTRYCMQIIVAAEDKAMSYWKALAGDHEMSEAVLDVWTDGLVNMPRTLKEDFGIDTLYNRNETLPSVAPEYPFEEEGGDTVVLYTITPEMGTGAVWNMLREGVMDRDNIDVWYEAPGKHLIQDPITKTILGVQIEKQGKLVNIRAKNGVVLATGGFENNPQMRQDFLGLPTAAVKGSFYNTGDGIKMAMEVGADLWHMNIWEGNGGLGGATVADYTGDHAYNITGAYATGSLILVNRKGDRFLREDEATRHGKIEINDWWHHAYFTDNTYLIMDADKYNSMVATNAIPEKYLAGVVSADTIETLASELGMENLPETVKQYNDSAASGVDAKYGRSAASMTAIGKAPYYAMEMKQVMLNTQGGPRRSEKAEIVDVNGEAIPHLYSAGELGGIAANLYQGAGNVAECLVFGKIAGTNAAAPKAELPAYNPVKVESKLVYTLGNDPDKKEEKQEFTLGDNEYLGEGQGMGGTITVKVKLNGDKIEAVTILDHNEIAGICEPAIEKVPQAIVDAQSTEVDGVSGATMTSNGIKAAVSDALSKK